MKYDHDSTFVASALGVIKGADLDEYGRMLASGWDLRLAFKVEDITSLDIPEYFRQELTSMFPDIYGVTGKDGSGFSGVTFVNVPRIKQMAGKFHMPLSQFAADVLVHEFTHYYLKTGEPLAFQEGSRFACLPGIAYSVCTFAQNNEGMFWVQELLGSGY